jgi:hypothetical protein
MITGWIHALFRAHLAPKKPNPPQVPQKSKKAKSSEQKENNLALQERFTPAVAPQSPSPARIPSPSLQERTQEFDFEKVSIPDSSVLGSYSHDISSYSELSQINEKFTISSEHLLPSDASPHELYTLIRPMKRYLASRTLGLHHVESEHFKVSFAVVLLCNYFGMSRLRSTDPSLTRLDYLVKLTLTADSRLNGLPEPVLSTILTGVSALLSPY